jgi:SAM-dependent methyltransferase
LNPIRAAECPNCGAGGLTDFYEVKDVPIHSCLLLPSRAAALAYPRRDIRLGWCGGCGFVANTIFDPSVHEYSPRYEETQHFSAHFDGFARRLAGQLAERHRLRGKTVLEIGCGKGEFLALLCELGDCRGIGIDPSYVPERNPDRDGGRVTFIQDFYAEKYAHLTADFICCRHTLEHIPATAEFVSLVRRVVGDRRDTVIFFEVPDVTRVLREPAFWDIYYEHCSYFSLGSLARLFRQCGFDVLDVARDFDDQYLVIEARPAGGPAGAGGEQPGDLEEMARDVEGFTRDCPETLARARADLRQMRAQGRRPVLWGSGSKAVAFLTTLGITDEVEVVVDINPFKHGKYLAGSGHPIVAPEFLKDYRPGTVIAMNPVYCREIQRDLDRLGVVADVVPVNRVGAGAALVSL